MITAKIGHRKMCSFLFLLKRVSKTVDSRVPMKDNGDCIMLRIVQNS